MPIKLGIVPVTPFEQNCSILVCQETGDAAVVDPGGDIEKILAGVKQMGGNVKKILLNKSVMKMIVRIVVSSPPCCI